MHARHEVAQLIHVDGFEKHQIRLVTYGVRQVRMAGDDDDARFCQAWVGANVMENVCP